MIYLFVTERDQQERLLAVMPSQEIAEQTARRLINRLPSPERAEIERVTICQLIDQQLIEQAVFRHSDDQQ